MNVRVDGAELFCSTTGSGPVCLVPSGIGTRPFERQLLPPLSDRYTFVVVDPRGSGRSTGDAAHLTFELLADDLDAVRRDLGVETVVVLGHSIMGVVAIEYGRRRPGSVSHVIAVGTPPHGDMARLSAEAAAFFEADASEERKRVWRENLAALPKGAPFREALLAQTPMRFFDPRFDAAPLFAEAELRPEFLRHVLGTLVPGWDVAAPPGPPPVPILVAMGRHDYTVPHVLWDGIPDRVPGVAVTLFERSGHQPFFEEPERFAAAVAEWIGEPR